jgi:hypothetical protein
MKPQNNKNQQKQRCKAMKAHKNDEKSNNLKNQEKVTIANQSKKTK